RPGTGGEILETGADADDEIGLSRDRVCARRTGDADGPQIERMVPGQRRLAGLRLGDRDRVAFHEGLQRLAGTGVVHAAAGDDHRLAGRADELCGFLELCRVGPRAPPAPGPRLEEALGP